MAKHTQTVDIYILLSFLMIIITIIIFISIIIILHRAHFHVTLDMMVIILLKQKNSLFSSENLAGTSAARPYREAHRATAFFQASE